MNIDGSSLSSLALYSLRALMVGTGREKLNLHLHSARIHSSMSTNQPRCYYSSTLLQVELVDPCIAADGHTYERAAIEAWLQQHDSSPVNGEQLTHKRIVANHVLKSVMAMY